MTKASLPVGEDNPHYSQRPIALKLHLELNTENLEQEEWDVLRKFANVKDGITRDIIIPMDMTLHALHYAIQKLFGWQNSHLHHFAFPKDVFNKVTENSLTKWCSLCGIYFRFPEEELDDFFWDEDYDQSKSFKTWLKNKYTGPYFYGGLGDYYYENQLCVKELKSKLPMFEVIPSFDEYLKDKTNKTKKIVSIDKATLEEFQRSISFGMDIDHLLERLSVLDYLKFPDGNNYFEDPLEESIEYLENQLEYSLQTWSKTIANIEKDFESFEFLIKLSTIRLQGISDKLEYYYDYGDDWKVEITCTDIYYNDYLENELGDIVDKVLKTHSPICVASDGLPLFDDIGGIYGFVNFLKHLHKNNKINEKLKLEAKSLGWTGMVQKPENML